MKTRSQKSKKRSLGDCVKVELIGSADDCAIESRDSVDGAVEPRGSADLGTVKPIDSAYDGIVEPRDSADVGAVVVAVKQDDPGLPDSNNCLETSKVDIVIDVSDTVELKNVSISSHETKEAHKSVPKTVKSNSDEDCSLEDSEQKRKEDCHNLTQKKQKPDAEITKCTKGRKNKADKKLNKHSKTKALKQFCCDICQAVFSRNCDLKRHSAIHTGEKPHQCPTCGKAFFRKHHLADHVRTHSGERPYVCSVCGTGYSTASNLKLHVRTHTKEKPYQCSICNKLFTRSQHVKTHQLVHKGEKPFMCSYCGKSFREQGKLARHNRIHTGERPWQCNICPKSFIHSSALTVHLRYHAGEKRHKCLLCTKAYVDKRSLVKHLQAHLQSSGEPLPKELSSKNGSSQISILSAYKQFPEEAKPGEPEPVRSTNNLHCAVQELDTDFSNCEQELNNVQNPDVAHLHAYAAVNNCSYDNDDNVDDEDDTNDGDDDSFVYTIASPVSQQKKTCSMLTEGLPESNFQPSCSKGSLPGDIPLVSVKGNEQPTESDSLSKLSDSTVDYAASNTFENTFDDFQLTVDITESCPKGQGPELSNDDNIPKFSINNGVQSQGRITHDDGNLSLMLTEDDRNSDTSSHQAVETSDLDPQDSNTYKTQAPTQMKHYASHCDNTSIVMNSEVDEKVGNNDTVPATKTTDDLTIVCNPKKVPSNNTTQAAIKTHVTNQKYIVSEEGHGLVNTDAYEEDQTAAISGTSVRSEELKQRASSDKEIEKSQNCSPFGKDYPINIERSYGSGKFDSSIARSDNTGFARYDDKNYSNIVSVNDIVKQIENDKIENGIDARSRRKSYKKKDVQPASSANELVEKNIEEMLSSEDTLLKTELHDATPVENLPAKEDIIKLEKETRNNSCTSRGKRKYKMEACEVCQHKFRKNGNDLMIHMRTHTGEKPFVCEVCKTPFRRKCHLKEHMQRHTGHKPHICPVCGRSFASIGNFKLHCRTHTKDKPYKCPQCQKSFARSQYLTNHLRVHKDERPYVCSLCGKTFREQSKLVIHTRGHSGERPYLCELCSKSFITSGALKVHLRSHANEKRHKCMDCGVAYADKRSLMKHLQKHAGEAK